MQLAIDGGPKAVTGPLPRFNTIGSDECAAVLNVTSGYPLSGYLGGERQGGIIIQALEEKWAEKFKVRHAIACNSATSGLLLACMAAGVGRGSEVVVPAYTMSATAAAPAFLGANVTFADIEDETFCLGGSWGLPSTTYAAAAIAVNLFGHPARLAWLRSSCDQIRTILIEDNAQGVLATEGGRYAGTVGHIGVYSLNVHKHLQCGEGGICVTDDDTFADRIRLGLNHGELASNSLGLNLRMTEVTAAIALQQLFMVDKIVAQRREIAEAIIEVAKPLLAPPTVREGCAHSYYMIPWLTWFPRKWIVDALVAEGVPVREGYTKPLYRLPVFNRDGAYCCVTELVESEIITYENCAWSPTGQQLKQFKEAFEKVGESHESSSK